MNRMNLQTITIELLKKTSFAQIHFEMPYIILDYRFIVYVPRMYINFQKVFTSVSPFLSAFHTHGIRQTKNIHF